MQKYINSVFDADVVVANTSTRIKTMRSMKRDMKTVMHQKEEDVYKEKQEWEDQGYLFTWMQPKSWMTMSRTSKRNHHILLHTLLLPRCVLCAWERLSLCKWLRSNSPCDFMITERWCEGGCGDETLVSVRGTEGKPEESEEDYFLSLPRQEEELKTHSYTVCHSRTKASFQPKLHRE